MAAAHLVCCRALPTTSRSTTSVDRVFLLRSMTEQPVHDALGLLSRRVDGQSTPIVAIILGTSTRFLQRILQTVALDLNQWIICALTASSIVIASEIYKAIQRGRVGGSSGTETESVRALTNADPQFTRNG